MHNWFDLIQNNTTALTRGNWAGEYYTGKIDEAGLAHGLGVAKLFGWGDTLIGSFVHGAPSVGILDYDGASLSICNQISPQYPETGN